MAKKSFDKKTYESNLTVDVYIPLGIVHTIAIRDPKVDSLPLGWAQIAVDPESPTECVLWAIVVREKFRRLGYGKELIKELQKRYERITTQHSQGITDGAGINLCVSCGFKIKKRLFRNQPGDCTWSR